MMRGLQHHTRPCDMSGRPCRRKSLKDVLVCAVAAYNSRRFPPGFKFGAATSSYQIEGAWNVSDKSESIWDRLTHSKPSIITDGATGDVACNSYYNWEDDINIAAELGLHFYRFSLSWPRLLPTSFIDKISSDATNYYNKLIDGLIKRGIEPVVTLYHWDLPQKIQDLGGWANPYIADWFADYARVAYRLFGDRVKIWITVNEPVVACDIAYNTGFFAPGIKVPEFGNYLCGKNMLLAHAKAWRIYDEEFRSKYHGKVGLTNQIFWHMPETEEDEEITEMVRQYMKRRVANVCLMNVTVPDNKQLIDYVYYTPTRLLLLVGISTYDYYGMNYYTSRTVRKAKDGESFGSWPLEDGAVELGAVMSVKPDWKKAASMWLWSYAPGLRHKLVWLKKTYGDVEILILENGVSSFSGQLDDDFRVKYYKDHLEQVWLAITEDQVNVTSYTAWTMIDNFEWCDGYNVKFGLYDVNVTDPKRTRTPRASAKYYAKVIRSHSLDVDKYNAKAELVLVSAVWCKNPREFPSGFIFGAATAAYQIEGAWNVSDKGESIWDRFVHTNPGAVKNEENGDVAADSYHNWQQDIDIASDIGLHFYRFSVSWPRLLPTGFINIKSEDGKNYYNKLIDGLLAKGIEPVVTLYHWDLPQPIQDLGKVSFANNLLWIEPLTPADEELAELGLQHSAGRYSHPIYSKKGGWPPSIEKVMEDYSKKQGFNISRLPRFTKEEIKLIRGSYDFCAFNHYTTRLIRPAQPGEDPGFWYLTGSPELNAVLVSDPSWPSGASDMMLIYPEGMRRMIAWLRKEYGDLPFLITENGYSTSGHKLDDPDRIKFIKDYLEQVLLSIWVDGAKVFGYTYWSLIDNFEWTDGYGVKFGLYEVDYNDTLRTRTQRESARYFSDVIRTNSIDGNDIDA
ncbi:Lactase-phlorizin hydrolase [Papilio machaon]|uniref:beta-glucosidase n=1 Tax=Papilio machaon TaxID=76193 RepID=A0A0N1I6T9_PAPMA|nr:Lactase-phlorizin hydrolase [Papilio machaon]